MSANTLEVTRLRIVQKYPYLLICLEPGDMQEGKCGMAVQHCRPLGRGPPMFRRRMILDSVVPGPNDLLDFPTYSTPRSRTVRPSKRLWPAVTSLSERIHFRARILVQVANTEPFNGYPGVGFLAHPTTHTPRITGPTSHPVPPVRYYFLPRTPTSITSSFLELPTL